MRRRSKERPRFHRRKGLIALVCVLSLTAASCGGDEETTAPADDGGAAETQAEATPAAPETLTVTSSEYTFEPDKPSVPAGWVEVTQTNAGEEPHMLQMFQLAPGATIEQFEPLITSEDPKDEVKAFKLGAPVGGVTTIEPGASATTTLQLEEANYAFVCFVEGHHARGMITPFEVTAAEGETAEPAEVAGEIKTVDFDFIVPDDFTGQGTYAVVNEGPQPHEMDIARLKGATLEEVEGFLDSPDAFAGPPPKGVKIAGSGGAGGQPPGRTQYVDLNLKPGVYLLVCFIPDRKTGKSHAQLGMAKALEIE